MPDETKRVEGLVGPYAGMHIDLPTADADAAIKDGWARDPFAPPGEPVDWTPEKIEQATMAAEKALRKVRGEDDGESKKKPKAEAKSEAAETAKSYEAESGTRDEGYQTRDVRRGRPPKPEK